MRKKEITEKAVAGLEKLYPDAVCSLTYTDAYQLLIATRLSAQCTDKQVNKVTEKLFPLFPDAFAIARLTPDELRPYIASCGFKSKADNIVATCRILVEKYDGQVPRTMEELTALPGVGRKTANVIASVVYNKPAMAVDTHVFRVANRIGLTNNSKTPLETEKELVKHIPEEQIPIAHHWLILHGRYTCIARKPKCEECGLKPWCKYFLSPKKT